MKLLASVGLPILDGAVVENVAETLAAQQEFGPVVRVRTALETAIRATTADEVLGAFKHFETSGENVIVEADTTGDAYQLLMVGGRLAWAAPLAEVTPEVGTALDLSTRVHPSIERAAALAARVIGLDIALVEIVANNLMQPLREQSAAFTGVSTGAKALTKITAAPLVESISGALLDHLFGNSRPGRIPVVGVSGTSGTTATTRFLGEILGATQQRIGIASSDGVFLNQRRLPAPLGNAWHAAQQVLANRTVDTAIIENDLAEIAHNGLAYDRCAVGVVLNLDPNLTLPLRGIDNIDQLYAVLRTQVDVVLRSGVAVLNANDSQVLRIAELSDGEVMLFSADGITDSVRTHLGNGKRAVYFHNGAIILAEGKHELALQTGECGMCISNAGSHETAHRTTIVSAIAAAWALGTPIDALQIGLASYVRNLSAVSIAA